jgi:hypothetical protein
MTAVAERSIEQFRTQFRAEHYGPRYSGWAHLASTSLGSLIAIAFALSRVKAPAAWEFLIPPATFFIANLVEFLMHRGPMHRPMGFAREIYERHTLQHHYFYTHVAMVAETARDFKMVLFPPAALFLFLGVIGTPIGALFYFLVSPNAGWLYGATAVGYFLTYEWLHLAYHLPPESRVGRLPFMAALRRHHTIHHDLSRMARWNFNITFPICDRIFGTHYELVHGR